MGMITKMGERLDSWMNELTGIGVKGTDKRLDTYMNGISPIPETELCALFHSDDVAHRIVTCLPDEAMSRYYSISGPDSDITSAWMLALEELGAWETLRNAAVFSRLYGGGAIVLGVDDGQNGEDGQSLPLNMDNIRSVDWVRFSDKRRIKRLTYGEGDLYRVQPVTYRYGAKDVIVHKSRLILLGGADTDDDTRERNGGWDLSVLQRVYPILRDSQAAWDAVAIRLQESSYSKTVIKGLAAMLAAGQEAAVKARLQLLNASRSTARTVILDSEESYERDMDPMGGVGDTLERYQTRVAAAAGMPVTKLWGTAASGLNATGEGDADNWSRTVQAHRISYIQPALEVLLEVVGRSKSGPLRGQLPEDWSVHWPELEPMNDKERAEIYRANADADAIYLANQVLAPEEVAIHRFGVRGYEAGPSIRIDIDERESALQLRDFTPEVSDGEDTTGSDVS